MLHFRHTEDWSNLHHSVIPQRNRFKYRFSACFAVLLSSFLGTCNLKIYDFGSVSLSPFFFIMEQSFCDFLVASLDDKVLLDLINFKWIDLLLKWQYFSSQLAREAVKWHCCVLRKRYSFTLKSNSVFVKMIKCIYIIYLDVPRYVHVPLVHRFVGNFTPFVMSFRDHVHVFC